MRWFLRSERCPGLPCGATVVALAAAIAILASAPAVLAAPATGGVCLHNSAGAPIAGASMQYYSSGWHQLGTTDGSGCTAAPAQAGPLPVGVTLGGLYVQRTNDFAVNPTVTFQTIKTTVTLLDSAGNGIAGGAAQYYGSGWHQLGTTDAIGSVTAELLPGSMPFGMNSGGLYNQVTQDNSINPTVTFQTVKTAVKLLDSAGNGIAGGAAQYYGSGWHQLGATDATGSVTAELLPGSMPFGMTSGGLYNQVTQDNSTNAFVTFQTVKTAVKVVDASGNAVPGATVQYYGNGWHPLGQSSSDGNVVAELLGGTIPFSASLAKLSKQVSQDIGSNANVTIALGVATPPRAQPSLTLDFVSATATQVTWRIGIKSPADVFLWDTAVQGCTGSGGASCGGIGANGVPGKFAAIAASADGQALLVTQAYTKNGDSCDVDNTVQWNTDGGAQRQSLAGSYTCSGTPALGLPLLGASFLAAIGVAWFVRRRLA
ncbi:MAG: hypothetical protein ACRDG3_00770 [Tepidiformaceae bacterium]